MIDHYSGARKPTATVGPVPAFAVIDHYSGAREPAATVGPVPAFAMIDRYNPCQIVDVSSRFGRQRGSVGCGWPVTPVYGRSRRRRY